MVFDTTPDDLRSSEATLNSTSGSLGRSSFEVTEAIEASETTLHSSSTNEGLLRSQVMFFEKFRFDNSTGKV